jgi:hypothetical protein
MRGAHKSTSRSERGHIEALLDDALRMTFPASDPIAPAIDREPPAAKQKLKQDAGRTSRPDSTGATGR